MIWVLLQSESLRQRNDAITFFRDGPLQKWWGGGGNNNKKKFMQGKMPRKKIHAKKKVKKKKIMQKEGPMVTFSGSLSFFQKVWVLEINNITTHNMNKQFVALKKLKHNRTRIKDTPTLLVPFTANGKLVFSILAIN